TFDNESIIRFVESAGVPLKEEDHGRMFPVSDKAKDVLDVFTEVLEQNNVEVRFNTVVSELLSKDGSVTGVRLVDGTELSAGNVIITTGGRSVPHTGSTGDGHRFARSLGHTVTERSEERRVGKGWGSGCRAGP